MFPILRPLLHTAALACALPALAADPQPASGGWAQPDPAPIGYAVLTVSASGSSPALPAMSACTSTTNWSATCNRAPAWP